MDIHRLNDIAPVGLGYLDAELRFRYVNRWLADMNGLPVAAHLGRRIDVLLREVAAGTIDQLEHVLRTGEPVVDGEVTAVTPAHPDERRCYRHSYFADTDAGGKVVGICCVVQDVTEKRRAEEELAERNRQLDAANGRLAQTIEQLKRSNGALTAQAQDTIAANARLAKAKRQLQRLALCDALTGIGNRMLFDQRLARSMGSAGRRNRELALLVADLDGFKEINDRLGHAAGDEVLKEFVVCLKRELGTGDQIFRLGGDEFAVLLEPRRDAFEEAKELATGIARRAAVPLHISGHSCSIGVSIGIAVFPLHGGDAHELLRKADAAMYEAKKHGQVLAGASELGATTVLRQLEDEGLRSHG